MFFLPHDCILSTDADGIAPPPESELRRCIQNKIKYRKSDIYIYLFEIILTAFNDDVDRISLFVLELEILNPSELQTKKANK